MNSSLIRHTLATSETCNCLEGEECPFCDYGIPTCLLCHKSGDKLNEFCTLLPTDLEKLETDIKEWKAVQEWLAKAKERESELRKSIADRVFAKMPNGAFPKGTSRAVVNTPNLAATATLKSQHNYEILVEMMVPTLERLGDRGAELVRTKHELSLTRYKALTPEEQRIADEMLLVKQGNIQLELSE